MTDDPTLGVAQDLRAIVALAADLHEQAAAKASHHDMPGGPAMVMLGPVAPPSDRERRGELIEAAWLRQIAEDGSEWCSVHETTRDQCAHRLNPWADEDANWEPPLQTILFWTEDHHEVVNPTVATEAEWLLTNLDWYAANEVHWEDMARDIEAARRRLEAVLYAGEREERSTVPCIDCELDRDGNRLSVLLVRRYATDPRGDRWVCPRCKRPYDEAAFVRAQHVDGARRGTDRHVLVDTAAKALQVHPSKLRRLANACDLATKSLMVWWPTARAERVGATHGSDE